MVSLVTQACVEQVSYLGLPNSNESLQEASDTV